MSYWKKLFTKVEGVIETALAKIEDLDDGIIEEAPPPVREVARKPESSDSIADLAYSVAREALTRVSRGYPVPTDVALRRIYSECPVCGQDRVDAIMTGVEESYLDFNGDFDEERFKSSLICRRCRVNFGASPEHIERAKIDWEKLSKDAKGMYDVDKAAGEETARMYKFMYSYKDEGNKE